MKKKILALILALAMLCSLTACGEKETQSTTGSTTQATETASTTTSKYAFSPTYFAIDTSALSLEYIGRFCFSGDQIFFTGTTMAGEEPMTDEVTGETIVDETTGEAVMNTIYQTKLFRMDPSSGEVTTLDGYQPTEIPEGQYGSTSIDAISAGADGTVWLAETMYSYYYDLPENFDSQNDDAYNYYVSGDNGTRIIHVDKDGTVLSSAQLESTENSYFGSFIITEDGTICTTDYTNILLYGEDGKLSATIEVPSDNSIQDLINLGNNKIGCTLWASDGDGSGNYSNYLTELDLAGKALGEAHKMPTSANTIYPGLDDYDYIYDNNGTLYGCTYDSTESTRLFSWLDCDIDSSNFSSSLVFAEDGRVIVMENVYDYSGNGSNSYNFIVMNPVDPSTIPVKQELTLACYSLDWKLRSVIVNFNKSQDDVRIVVNEYSQYATADNWQAGIQKLNTEILSGNIPDIILFNSYMPVDQYGAKGILTDLWPLIDSDSELSRDDLMTHFFDSLSVDGKLYQIVSSFNLSTVAGKTSVVGSGSSWTIDQLMEILDQQPEGTSIFSDYDTKSSILENCVARNIESFIDWSSMTCSFDSQEFIDLLTFANQFPLEIADDSTDEEYEYDAARLRSGKQMLYSTDLYGFSSYLYAANVFGEETNFIGYPTTGTNGNCFTFYESMGISSKCANVDAAWRFLRTFLTEDYQSTNSTYQFPTNKHVFESVAQKYMTPEYETDAETGEQVESAKTTIWYDDNTQIPIYSMTQEEYNAFMTLYNNTTNVSSYNEEIYNLITDQTDAFFNGQKTAEETAKLIQSSVSLYVFENA